MCYSKVFTLEYLQKHISTSTFKALLTSIVAEYLEVVNLLL